MLASSGWSQLRVTRPLPTAAVKPVGFAGAPPTGVALTSADRGLVPESFSATITKVYSVPFVRPGTT